MDPLFFTVLKVSASLFSNISTSHVYIILAHVMGVASGCLPPACFVWQQAGPQMTLLLITAIFFSDSILIIR